MTVIDIHSHILPGLDDGAVDMAESIHMIRMAKRQGICEVVATPHFTNTFMNTDPRKICSLCREVERTSERELGIRFRIWPGQEIMYGEEAMHLLAEKKLLTIADTRYVLIEFLPSAPYSYIYQAVRNLCLDGYFPVIAHAERYASLRREERIRELKDQGAYIQLNFRPVGGQWYDSRTRWCRKLLYGRYVDFLGTDMHNTRNRRPQTAEAKEWMQKHLQSGYRTKILSGNARKMLSGDKL